MTDKRDPFKLGTTLAQFAELERYKEEGLTLSQIYEKNKEALLIVPGYATQ